MSMKIYLKVPHSLKNRIYSKRGYFENGEDASVRSLDVRVVVVKRERTFIGVFKDTNEDTIFFHRY